MLYMYLYIQSTKVYVSSVLVNYMGFFSNFYNRLVSLYFSRIKNYVLGTAGAWSLCREALVWVLQDGQWFPSRESWWAYLCPSCGAGGGGTAIGLKDGIKGDLGKLAEWHCSAAPGQGLAPSIPNISSSFLVPGAKRCQHPQGRHEARKQRRSTGHLARKGVGLAHLVPPVAWQHEDDGELGQEEGLTDSIGCPVGSLKHVYRNPQWRQIPKPSSPTSCFLREVGVLLCFVFPA